MSVEFGVRDAAGVLDRVEADAIWTAADEASNDAEPRNVIVNRAVAELYVARARAEALELNREGRYDEAQARLEATARRITKYAGHDPRLRVIVRELEERDDVFSAPMSARASKWEFFQSANVTRMRTMEGKAKRS